jgi:hypothetical protein
MAPRFALRTIPPLAANIKLNAINKVRLAYNYATPNSVPPAQITLTPAVPTMGQQSYLSVLGRYVTAPGNALIELDSSIQGSVEICFARAVGKTYLADVAIGPGGAQYWDYACLQPGVSSMLGEVTMQQGHLLIPLIATASNVVLRVGPVTGFGLFISAEVTQVG